MTDRNLELSGAHDHDPAYDLINAVSQGQGLRITRDGQLIATLTPAGSCLPTRAEQLTRALQEHRQVVAAEVRRHLSNVRAEARRYEEALAHYDGVFELRLTGATSDSPATEGTPAS